MNHAETKDLLTVIGRSYLAFKITADDAKTWANALADMHPSDALDALDAHIKTSTYPPTPAHLRQQLRALSPPPTVESRPAVACGRCDHGFVASTEQRLVARPADGEAVYESVTVYTPCRDCRGPSGRADLASTRMPNIARPPTPSELADARACIDQARSAAGLRPRKEPIR